MPTFVEALVNGWWQGILLIAAVWLLMRETARMSAATRLAIWQVTLAVVVLLPVLQWLPQERRQVEPRMVSATPTTAPEGRIEPAPQTSLLATQPPLVELREADAAGFFLGLGLALAFLQFLRVVLGGVWMDVVDQEKFSGERDCTARLLEPRCAHSLK